MKRILQALKRALRWLWSELCDLAGELYQWALHVGQARWLALVLGMVITALPALHGWVTWPPVFAVVAAVLHAGVRWSKGKPLDWKNYVSFLGGALTIWALSLI